MVSLSTQTCENVRLSIMHCHVREIVAYGAKDPSRWATTSSINSKLSLFMVDYLLVVRD